MVKTLYKGHNTKTITFDLNHETKIPLKLIKDAPTSGPFDEYADYILENYNVDVTLNDSITFLKEYGAWSINELQDLNKNKARILWVAILDCIENKTQYFYMGL